MRAITVTVPDDLFARLSARAADAERSVEAEAFSLLAAAVTEESGLSAGLTANLAELIGLGDDALWRVADRSRLEPAEREELADLNYQQQAGSLAPDQRERLAALVALSERLILIRAEALLLLKQRGVDVAPLLVAR